MANICSNCGREVRDANMKYCPSCGSQVVAGRNDGLSDGLDFLSPEETQSAPSQAVNSPANQSWSSNALTCKPLTFGPYIKSYKVHGSCIYSGGKDGGDLALTFTGFEFVSKINALRFFYQSIIHAEKISSNDFIITTDDGNTYEFKAVNAKAWVEKIASLKQGNG